MTIADTTPSRRFVMPPLRIPRTETASWIITGAVGAVAAAIRLSDLGQAQSLVFDETYYVKDAWALLTQGYEGEWLEDQDAAFANGDTSGLQTTGSFIVHPQIGKWLIGLGMHFFGQNNPVGWRISAAIAGIIGVLLVCRLAWRLFSSIPVTLMAGLFLATDGIHVVMSRVGLLDIFLSTFVLGAFLAVVKDQQQYMPRLEAALADKERQPHILWRPWLLSAGILLGLACGVKWSGLYAVAVLGLFVVMREALLRRRYGDNDWPWQTIFPDGIVAFLYLVVVSGTVYVLSWTSWFVNMNAWGHSPENTSLWGRFHDWLSYHDQMWGFHTGLTTEHTYQSNPLGWMLQIRPTSFWFDQSSTACGAETCTSAITALGNPLLWWAGIIAVGLLLWHTLMRRRWETGVLLAGFLAMYMPWFLYLGRTVFTFYTVAFAPYVAIGVAWMIGRLVGAKLPGLPSVRRNRWLRLLALVLAGAILASAVYFAPLWTGWPIPYDSWHDRMWFDSWI